MVTNNQVVNFRDIASLYLRHAKERTKLHHALDKLVKKLKKVHEKYMDDQQDLRTEAASTDTDTKILLKDDKGGFQYTKDKEKELRASLRTLGDKAVDVEPHFVLPNDLPPSLEVKYEGNDNKIYTLYDYDVRTAFEGFVIETEA